MQPPKGRKDSNLTIVSELLKIHRNFRFVVVINKSKTHKIFCAYYKLTDGIDIIKKNFNNFPRC